jgi:hypothetical protein
MCKGWNAKGQTAKSTALSVTKPYYGRGQTKSIRHYLVNFKDIGKHKMGLVPKSRVKKFLEKRFCARASAFK